MRAVQISEFGGPEVLRAVEIEAPSPAPGEVLIEVDSAGVDLSDTAPAMWSGALRLPLVPGVEVVGRALGGELDGRRVAALVQGGGYAELVAAPRSAVCAIPESLPDPTALAMIRQGTTAWHLLRTCAGLRPGETVVVHCATGGVGSLAVQLARQWHAGRVVATVHGADRVAGVGAQADEVLDLSPAQGAEQVRELLVGATGGRGPDVVLELTGGHVFDGSLAALAPLGRLVTYGCTSGVAPAPVDPASLLSGSRQVHGFWLPDVLTRVGGLEQPMEELLSLVRTGRLLPRLGESFPLERAEAAHRTLRERRAGGKVTLRIR